MSCKPFIESSNNKILYMYQQLFVRSQVPTSGDLLLIFGKEWIKSVSQVEHLEWRVTDHNSQALIKAD